MPHQPQMVHITNLYVASKNVTVAAIQLEFIQAISSEPNGVTGLAELGFSVTAYRFLVAS